ncbi:FkbM family methyltransferase [Sphingomonas vulcanisoli]|uniref:FkbM family methyltransferase n=1 Tax=Sphingomonas vulcanisoli TaxID=1658060 RepID=A0ABX0TVD3_9SPHN|nr:FkbM family methyltransferase [Sphingomonas vulcanisoli]NIJ09463.1 FkbM family methyltransferase [Sphingomonas vulcanisoli]
MARKTLKWLLSVASARLGLTGTRIFDIEDLITCSRDANQAAIRKLCAGVYLGDDTVLCRVLGRYKLFADTRDVGLSSHLMLDGYWEMWLTELMMRTIKPGMVVADVGANLGYFTLLMADLVGPRGRVHAFEPNLPINRRLRRSVDVNGFADRVIVHDSPLGSEAGRLVTMQVPANEPKNAHVGPARYDGIVQDTYRMDQMPQLLDVDVLKIDTEGAERDVWDGMAGILANRSKPLTIFLEFASVRYPTPDLFIDEMIAQGFSIGELTMALGVLPRTKEEILAAPDNVDQMLVLKR